MIINMRRSLTVSLMLGVILCGSILILPFFVSEYFVMQAFKNIPEVEFRHSFPVAWWGRYIANNSCISVKDSGSFTSDKIDIKYSLKKNFDGNYLVVLEAPHSTFTFEQLPFIKGDKIPIGFEELKIQCALGKERARIFESGAKGKFVDIFIEGVIYYTGEIDITADITIVSDFFNILPVSLPFMNSDDAWSTRSRSTTSCWSPAPTSPR